MARGVPRAEAERLLIEAFLDDAVDALGDEAVAEALKGTISTWVNARNRAGSEGDMNAPRTCLRPTMSRRSAAISRSCRGRSTASRWSISTMRASAQKPKAVIDAMTRAYTEEYANVHRGLHFLSNAATDAYEVARETVRTLPERGAHRRDHLHQERHRGDEPRRGVLRPGDRRGRRDRALDHGAPLQHRAVELPPRAEGRRHQMGADRR